MIFFRLPEHQYGPWKAGHGSASFHQGGNNPRWIMYIVAFIALIVPQQIDLLAVGGLAFDYFFLKKDWHNVKGYLIRPESSDIY